MSNVIKIFEETAESAEVVGAIPPEPSNGMESLSFDDNAKLELNEDSRNTIVKYTIERLIREAASSHYSSELIKLKILAENTFDALWNEYPESREGLALILINQKRYFDNNFVNNRLLKMEEYLKNSTSVSDQKIRLLCINNLYTNYDYLSEIERMSKISTLKQVTNSLIEKINISFLNKDDRSKLLELVQNVPGATDLKADLLSRSFDLGIIHENFIEKISKSAPIKLKRTACAGLSSQIRQYKYRIRENEIKEKLDHLEKMLMMFSSETDYYILHNMIESVSVNNLPWIMPSAAKHPQIVKRINRRIESGV